MKILLPVRTIVIVLIFGLSLISPVFARDLGQIQTEISRKQAELDALQKNLNSAQQNLTLKKSEENTAQDEVSKLTAEIASIEAQLKYNQLRIDNLNEQRKLKILEREENDKLQDLQVVNSYTSWKTSGIRNAFFGGSNVVKSAVYNEAVTTKSHGGILGIAQQLEVINFDYEESVSESENLQKEMESLVEKKAIAQAKLDSIQQSVIAASSDVSKLRSQSSTVQQQITQLQKAQQDLQNAEKQVVNNNGGGNNNPSATNPLNPGDYYFSGTGRDTKQGHGVGLSQYGALGAALKGWDYKKIIEFYFPGTKVGKANNLPASIDVNGNNQVPTEAYVAGAGEIPDKACEDLGVAFNPNNIWACWPREAIKAQMVVFRTYGARRSGFVYGDARGQVYKGGNAKQWAADATRGMTVNIGSSLADVYYSADNNQGKGTANNDTVWSNYSGDGTVISYLRSVNDTSFAYKGPYTNWSWRTNSYSVAKIDTMLNWSGQASQVPSGTRNFVSGLKSNIGTLQSISFERDPSGRVKKVVLTGNKGTKKMAGWVYKSIWNIWVGTEKPSGQTDYIYSLTFYLQKV